LRPNSLDSAVIKRYSPDDFLDEDDPDRRHDPPVDDLIDFPRSAGAPPAAPPPRTRRGTTPARGPDRSRSTAALAASRAPAPRPDEPAAPPAPPTYEPDEVPASASFLDARAFDAQDVPSFIAHLERTLLNDTIVHRETIPPRPSRRVMDASHLGPRVARILEAAGIDGLWSHQEEGIRHLQQGDNVVVATPTSSGKTLIYNAAVLDDLMQHPSGCAIYIFPLKALEQDQLDELRTLLGNLACGLTAEIYDGDTKPHVRDRIRKNPPNILITTPDMLHSGLLAFHEAWEETLRNLRWLVVDELHTYNGIFGSHVLHLFRRLSRVCACYDSAPRYVTCSATIGNPQELAERLFGRPFLPITDSGAPTAARHFLFVDPADSPNTVASRLLQAGVQRSLRTIVFTRARAVTELVYRWATQHRRDLARKISSYRAGYLPEERRQIESQLMNGDLLGVVSTSALELGIDIGGLDICVLVGYPGSIVNTWQRAGRVGRQGRESLVILLASRDALDQYFMKHPEQFFGRDIEDAVADPGNRYILEQHLPCAARELPITADEPGYCEIPGYREALDRLTERGELLQSADGDVWFASRKQPHRFVNMRAIGESWTVVSGGRGGGPRGNESSHQPVGREPDDEDREAGHRGTAGRRGSADERRDRQGMDLFPPDGTGRRRRSEEHGRDHSTPNDGAGPVAERHEASAGSCSCDDAMHAHDHGYGHGYGHGHGHGNLSPEPSDDGTPPIPTVRDGGCRYPIGTVSGGQLYSECYEGAVYLHRGRQYLIGERNPTKRQIEARLVDVPYYTRPKKEKETEILEELASKPMHGYQAKLGRLRVESQVIAFEKVRVGDGAVMSRHPLDCPVEVFETVGFWLEMDAPFKKHLKRRGHHHMGSLHATEHATKSLFPLLALSKGTDVGGICYPMHPQLRKGAIFIYDQYPGGIGLAEKGFDMLDRLLELTLGMVAGCDCEEGCPSCIHFPTCGAGNHPLDKAGCVHLLELLSGRAQLDAEALEVDDIEDEPPIFADWERADPDEPDVPDEDLEPHTVVFDLETQLSAAEVGGWSKTYLMRVSCGVVWDSRTDEFTTYFEDRVPDLIEHLKSADLVVGFNCIGFDYSVLRGYTRFDFRDLVTLDMLREIKEQLNFRVSLNSLAQSTLDKEKSADGLQALRWWKQGRLDLIETYCRDDVAITRDIWRYGRDKGYLLFDRKNEGRMRIPVDFSDKVLAFD
jgi:ATP-dependent helicase YprA (DUF1998 family)